ncbi:hypothetical protein Tco_1286909 [Tanacetum coccineum]
MQMNAKIYLLNRFVLGFLVIWRNTRDWAQLRRNNIPQLYIRQFLKNSVTVAIRRASIASFQRRGTLPSNTITNPKVDLKGITTQSGVAYQGPTIPTNLSPPKLMERETEVTKGTMLPTNNGSTKDVQPPVVQV